MIYEILKPTIKHNIYVYLCLVILFFNLCQYSLQIQHVLIRKITV